MLEKWGVDQEDPIFSASLTNDMLIHVLLPEHYWLVTDQYAFKSDTVNITR